MAGGTTGAMAASAARRDAAHGLWVFHAPSLPRPAAPGSGHPGVGDSRNLTQRDSLLRLV